MITYQQSEKISLRKMWGYYNFCLTYAHFHCTLEIKRAAKFNTIYYVKHGADSIPSIGEFTLYIGLRADLARR